MTEILPPNHLSLEEHVERIRKAMQSARDAIIDVAEAVRDCRLQMGEDVLQTEVASQLGMSASTLNKWISIGKSEFILSHRRELPPTFTGLYFITQIEKKYTDFYEKKAPENLQKLIETGRLNVSSQQADVQELLKEIKGNTSRMAASAAWAWVRKSLMQVSVAQGVRWRKMQMMRPERQRPHLRSASMGV